MLKSKAFNKKTKQGKVVKVVREHYLRDDIWSGSPLDPDCDPSAHKLAADADHYLIVDTNVALQQIDLLQHAAINDVIVLGVVLEEVKHRNNAVYTRLRALVADPDRRFFVFSNEHHKDTYVSQEAGETPNDRNDRAIRVAAQWYTQRLPSMQTILITDDADCRAKAQQMGLAAMSAMAYAQTRTDAPELVDLVARGRAEERESDARVAAAGTGPNKRQRLYEEHMPSAQIQAGIQSGIYHQGALRMRRHSPWEAYVSSASVGADILVKGRTALNRGIDGDVVVVALLPPEQWEGEGALLGAPGEDGAEAEEGASIAEAARPCGKVVGIIKRNWRTRGYCGALQPPRDGTTYGSHVLFCPVEQRFPFVRLHTNQAAALADKRIVVAIDGWDIDAPYPHGHYVRSLGTIGDRATETEVVLLEHDVTSAPFSAAVHACVPPLPWAVGPEDVADAAREDLRHLTVCSVDPPGCRDIDDALHVQRLPDGRLELGVHIADVTHFVKPETAMDEEASRRGTTVYLVDRRIDMLPKPLTEDICSLRADVDRLAFSVLWEVHDDEAGVRVGRARFTKSIIRSRAAMTYAEAQSRIDDTRMQDDITVGLRTLLRIARVLRAARAARGALQLASPEVRFSIDQETHDPTDVSMYQLRETNQMVEEMMLLANCTVAEHILRAFPTCALLRRHPTPEPKQFEPLLKAAAAVGVDIDPDTSKTLAASLDAAQRDDDPYFNKLLRIMATRCMTQALYCGSADVAPAEYHHYGLAAPIYTHFTSPIRRYADVMVHRLLAASLGLAPLPASSRDKDSVHSTSLNLNVRHHNAQLAGRASVELHTLIFFKGRTVVADARVVKVKANGLVVFVPKYGIEGPVYFYERGSEEASQYVLDDAAQTVHSAGGKLLYTIFDKAAVRISVREGFGHRRQLVLELTSRDELQQDELAVL